jgi:putative ABC transport system substrate-binding protein
VLLNEANPANRLRLKTVQAAAGASGTVIQPYGVATVEQLDGAFKAMAAARAQGLIVLIDPLIVRNRARITQLATGHRLPTIAGFSDFAQEGALMTYGPNVAALCRQAAGYVDKILKGARPGDLPVAQATQFEFVVNLKAAKKLGVTIPQSLLLRADRVVQ